MTASWKSEIARRPLIAGALGVLGIAVVGGAAYEVPLLFRRRYPPTPFDDLLDRLSDRESARRLGAAVLRMGPAFDAGVAAQKLRTEFAQKPLAEIVETDLSENRLVEVQGWVLPMALTQLCALAATVP
jgi:hypothetical protein